MPPGPPRVVKISWDAWPPPTGNPVHLHVEETRPSPPDAKREHAWATAGEQAEDDIVLSFDLKGGGGPFFEHFVVTVPKAAVDKTTVIYAHKSVMDDGTIVYRLAPAGTRFNTPLLVQVSSPHPFVIQNDSGKVLAKSTTLPPDGGSSVIALSEL